jgi:hypothetical protein
MDSAEIAECLSLLVAADAILLARGEGLLAAQLSMVIETLRGRVPNTGPGTADLPPH